MMQLPAQHCHFLRLGGGAVFLQARPSDDFFRRGQCPVPIVNCPTAAEVF
jgi:hypothetical protein